MDADAVNNDAQQEHDEPNAMFAPMSNALAIFQAHLDVLHETKRQRRESLKLKSVAVAGAHSGHGRSATAAVGVSRSDWSAP